MCSPVTDFLERTRGKRGSCLGNDQRQHDGSQGIDGLRPSSTSAAELETTHSSAYTRGSFAPACSAGERGRRVSGLVIDFLQRATD
jgi:hypothetical protein